MSDRLRKSRALHHMDIPATKAEKIDAMSTEELSSMVHTLSGKDRKRLQWICEKDLRDDRKAAVSEGRVRAAKLLVALLSESLDAIESLVAIRSSRWRYEVHFSLFLFIGDARALHGPSVDQRLLRLLGNYLMTVKAGTALAAWKAADTIASCWPARDALPPLEAAAMSGRYVAGRLSALAGLEELLQKRTDAERSRIEAVIRSMCIRDPSDRVRRVAGFALAGSE